MAKETAILDLPPLMPVYVETREVISARHCDNQMHVIISRDCGTVPPEEPPHDHEHTGEEPTPLRINVSDTLKVTEGLAVVVNRVAA